MHCDSNNLKRLLKYHSLELALFCIAPFETKGHYKEANT